MENSILLDYDLYLGPVVLGEFSLAENLGNIVRAVMVVRPKEVEYR